MYQFVKNSFGILGGALLNRRGRDLKVVDHHPAVLFQIFDPAQRFHLFKRHDHIGLALSYDRRIHFFAESGSGC